MTKNLTENMPKPDESGSEETQKAASGKVTLLNSDPPIKVGEAVSGLAAEGANGLNRQASIVVATLFSELQRKLDKAEEELKKLSPENAVFKSQIAHSERNKKTSGILNVISTLAFGFGIAILTGFDQDTAIAGWALIIIGLILSAVVIFRLFGEE